MSKEGTVRDTSSMTRDSSPPVPSRKGIVRFGERITVQLAYHHVSLEFDSSYGGHSHRKYLNIYCTLPIGDVVSSCLVGDGLIRDDAAHEKP